MGLYERMPYANFHELNLDTVMQVINQLPETIRTELEEALEDFPLPDGCITTAKLASSAVTSAKLASNAVLTSKIANGAVSAAKLATGAVTADKIAAEAVGTGTIEDEAVTFDKLASGFASVLTGTSAGSISVASGIGATYTQLADLEITETGTYVIMPWVMAYGVANSAEGYIDTNIAGTSGHTSGFGYGARWIHNVPAYTAASPSAFNWTYIRTLAAGDHVYLNAAHNTGAARNIRGNVRALRIK